MMSECGLESDSGISEELTCLGCGYNLRGLGADPVRCPECGATFDRDELWAELVNRRLLPWERSGELALTSRLIRTNLNAWLRPGRFFSRAAERCHRPIAHCGRLFFVQLSLAMLLCGLGWFMGKAVFVLHLAIRHGDLERALAVVLQSTRLTWTVDISLWFLLFLPTLMLPLVLAGFFRWGGRRRIGKLGYVGLVALLSPLTVLEALADAVGKSIVGASPMSVTTAIMVSAGLPLLYLIVLSWCCARQLLRLSVVDSIGTVLVSIGLAWATAAACSALHDLMIGW